MSSRVTNIIILILVLSNMLSVFYIIQFQTNNKKSNCNDMYKQFIKFKTIELNLNDTKMECFSKLKKDNKSPLVFYFTMRSCRICIEQCLTILNNYNDSIKKTNVIAICFFENSNMQKYFQKEYPNIQILKGNDFNIEITQLLEVDVPLFFMINDSGKAFNTFVPDKNSPNLTKVYLNNL